MTTLEARPDKRIPKRRFQYSLRLLILLTTLACELCAYCVPRIQRANYVRPTMCPKMFEHSGFHQTVVELDRDLQVVEVTACPACIWHSPPVYYVREKTQWLKREAVPERTVADAEAWITRLKRSELYRLWSFTEQKDKGGISGRGE